jgi:hypothetical protein
MIQAPIEQVPDNVKKELIEYLTEGNSKEDLAMMVLEAMNRNEMLQFLQDLRNQYKDGALQNMPKMAAYTFGL